MPKIADRKLGTVALTRRILGEVWRHPANRGHRPAAIARSLAWQVRKRVAPRRVVRPIYVTMRYWADPESGATSNVVYFTERFDPVEMAFLDRFVRSGDHVIDAGANAGLYSLFLATLVGGDGRIDVFEAAPAIASKCRENLALNGLLGTSAHLHEVAISDRIGELRFRGDRDVSSHVAAPGDRDERAVAVPCATLDSRIPETGRPLTVAKIDIEGAEAAGLAGFARRMEAGEPWVLLIEVVDNTLRLQGSSAAELRSLLDGFGYEVMSFDPAVGALRPATDGHEFNVVAVARSRRAQVDERLRGSPSGG